MTEHRVTRVEDVMSVDLVTATPHDDVTSALSKMADAHVRRLPVVEANGDGATLLGVITDRDVRLAANSPYLWGTSDQIAEELRGLRVADIMSADVAVVTPRVPLSEAAQIMIERRVGGLPVIEREPGRQRLVGIVTRTDCLAHLTRIL